jgi:hypothetical protein
MGKTMIFRLSAENININFKKDVRLTPIPKNLKFDDTLNRMGTLVLAGYSITFPKAFGLERGTLLANAMDASRLGYFKTGKPFYPRGAWFTITDFKMQYDWLMRKYFWYAYSSILGA